MLPSTPVATSVVIRDPRSVLLCTSSVAVWFLLFARAVYCPTHAKSPRRHALRVPSRWTVKNAGLPVAAGGRAGWFDRLYVEAGPFEGHADDGEWVGLPVTYATEPDYQTGSRRADLANVAPHRPQVRGEGLRARVHNMAFCGVLDFSRSTEEPAPQPLIGKVGA